nr:hypothetical protein DA06_08730 [Georgenia sp. SUBG003]
MQRTGAREGARISAPDATLTVKVDAAHTAGEYEIFEVTAPSGPTTPPHRTGWAKAHYVLRGKLEVQVDGVNYPLGPGDTVAIPPGAPHTFTVLTESCTFLVVSMTDAMGRFHADLDAAARGRPLEEAMDDVAAVLAQHDVTLGTAGAGRERAGAP